MYSFIETPLFTRIVGEYLSDEDYAKLQCELIRNPKAGAVIKGSGGVRKIRWASKGRGKRGGYRVVYFLRSSQGVFWMLTMYPKNVVDSIPGHVLNKIRKEIVIG